MLYRPSSFRKSAFAITTAVALASASALASFPAAAQQVNVVSTTASDCTSIQDSTKRAACMVERIDQHTKQMEQESARLKAQGEASDKRAADADAATDCIQFLTAGVKSGTLNKAEILEKAGGKLKIDNACPIAKGYGYARKAENTTGPRLTF